MICSGNKFVLCFDALRMATLHTNVVHTHVKRLPFIWSAFLYWSHLEMESFYKNETGTVLFESKYCIGVSMPQLVWAQYLYIDV